MIDISLDATVIEVGDQLTGYSLWTPDHQNAKPLDIKIGWRTEGKGNIDQNTIYIAKLEPFQRHNFDCPIPFTGPVSYDGQLLSIIWEVTVTRSGLLKVLPPMQTQEFRVVPRRSMGDRHP